MAAQWTGVFWLGLGATLPGTWTPGVAARGLRAAPDDSSARGGNLLTPSTLAQPKITIFGSPPPTSVVLVIAPVAREQARSAAASRSNHRSTRSSPHVEEARPRTARERGSLSRWQDGREPPSERASAAPRCRRQPFGPSGPRDASRSPRGGAAPGSAAHSDPTSSRRPAPAARRRRRPGTHLPRLGPTSTAHEHTRRDRNAPEPPKPNNSRTNKFGPN